MKVQKFKFKWNLVFLAMYEFVINSDRKTISQRLLTFFIWFEVHIQPFYFIKFSFLMWSRISAFKNPKILSLPSFLPAAPASTGLSALIHLFYDIGDIAGNIIRIQQPDDMWDLISLLDGQLTVPRAFEDVGAVFSQQPDSRI